MEHPGWIGDDCYGCIFPVILGRRFFMRKGGNDDANGLQNRRETNQKSRESVTFLLAMFV